MCSAAISSFVIQYVRDRAFPLAFAIWKRMPRQRQREGIMMASSWNWHTIAEDIKILSTVLWQKNGNNSTKRLLV